MVNNTGPLNRLLQSKHDKGRAAAAASTKVQIKYGHTGAGGQVVVMFNRPIEYVCLTIAQADEMIGLINKLKADLTERARRVAAGEPLGPEHG